MLKLIFVLMFILFVGFGWVNNIIKMCKYDFKAPYKAEVIRIIGIPIGPMGIVTGYMDIKDK